eukprot:352249-Chlamydomonas_euryale.AAC.18
MAVVGSSQPPATLPTGQSTGHPTDLAAKMSQLHTWDARAVQSDTKAWYGQVSVSTHLHAWCAHTKPMAM